MITKILNIFNIGVANLVYLFLRLPQEFSLRTLTNMGYFWDWAGEVYYLRIRDNHRSIYNFDGLIEFEEGNDAPEIDEEPIGDTHRSDVPMVHANHEEDEAWVTIATNLQQQQQSHYWEKLNFERELFCH